MKIIHLMAGDLSGGAARGAYWLHQGLRQLGVDSVLLGQSFHEEVDPSVRSLVRSKDQEVKLKVSRRLGGIGKLFYPRRTDRIFSTGFGGVDFTNHPSFPAADIVHLHWINGLVDIRTLKKVRKPIVWTMRDMWPFTGGCHYSMGCERYIEGCGACPQLNSARHFDLSRFVVDRKIKAYTSHITFVGISSWLSDCASRSKVLSGHSIKTISNNVDSETFFPVNPQIARRDLGFPQNKKLILVGSQHLTDFYKGLDLFLSAVKRISTIDLHIVFFGKGDVPHKELSGLSFSELGYVRDDARLRSVYSAADVFVAPSRMEAFGKTVAESMACGTPVVCFDSTGPADIVRHRITGYKAKAFDREDLARGISWVLNLSPPEKQSVRTKSRQHVVERFAAKVIATEYIALYKQLLGASRPQDFKEKTACDQLDGKFVE